MNVYGEMENVLNIVIKISLVSETKSKDKWEYTSCSNENTIQYYNTPYHFFNEINIQSEISELGLMNLNRNVPIILFSKLYSYYSNNYKGLKKLFTNKTDKNGKIIINQLFNEFHKMHKENIDDNFYIAIFGMEYIIPDYVVSSDIIKPIIQDIKSHPGNETIDKYDDMSLAKFSVRLKNVYNIARYELLRIAVDTGYSQGDYHTENLLLYEDAQELMVIDFGNAKTIPYYTHLKNNWAYLEDNNFVINKDTFRILKEILTDIYNTHYIDSEENSKVFQWIKHIDEEDMEIIGTIHKFRLLKISTPLHHQNVRESGGCDSNGTISLHNSNVQRYKKNTRTFDMYLSAKRSEYLFQNMALIDDDYSNHCLGYFWKKIFGKR